MNKIYKVVKILNDTALVINAGLNDGVEKGDKFTILYIGEPIIDSESGEELGKLELVKAKLQVSIVYDKMCLCETSYTSSIIMPNIFSEKKETFNVDPDDISYDFDLSLKIGDPAMLIKNAQKTNKMNEKNGKSGK